MEKISQAVILSAGLGTRLRPLTDNIPKVMVPFLGKPLLEYHLEQFKNHGVRDFFINIHYLSEKIMEYFGDGSAWGVTINYSLEKDILGTAGGVKQFESQLPENFFVVYGDMFSEVDYSKMGDAYFEKKDVSGMVIIGENDHPQDSDLVEVDALLKFIKIHIKPYKELPMTRKTLDAVYIFNKKILQYIPARKYWEIDHQLLPNALAAGENIYGYETNDFLYDIGTMERYGQVEAHLKNKKAAA